MRKDDRGSETAGLCSPRVTIVCTLNCELIALHCHCTALLTCPCHVWGVVRVREEFDLNKQVLYFFSNMMCDILFRSYNL